MFSFDSSSMLAVVFLLSLSGPTLAQTIDTLCDRSALPWAFNSLDQSPCLVAAALQSDCTGDGNFEIDALGPGQTYTAVDNDCQCNTVVYNLLSACTLCQGLAPGSWVDYSSACTNVDLNRYIEGIPDGTALPYWVFETVTNLPNETFDPNIAQELGDEPESGPQQGPVTAPATTSGFISPNSTPLTSTKVSTAFSTPPASTPIFVSSTVTHSSSSSHSSSPTPLPITNSGALPGMLLDRRYMTTVVLALLSLVVGM
ncbi:hypothetical protein SISNIDRAFT_459450 [Sistotremastrum niveocremeum HHB9708]|uniref:Expansin-like EG45 domain-containing protein n=1 Tax=Sistotremastrum niveocremeum HHB9708 TaxID=1314777 RepID=A0A164PKN7_9AGAM|nr:hypothetical protein SISNIDRAFT_459450 [Sistotremastrum niveocremeum HHB9708]